MENVVKQSSVECTSKMQQILQMMSELQPITSEIESIRCELGLNKSDNGGSVESFDSHYNRVDRLKIFLYRKKTYIKSFYFISTLSLWSDQVARTFYDENHL